MTSAFHTIGIFCKTRNGNAITEKLPRALIKKLTDRGLKLVFETETARAFDPDRRHEQHALNQIGAHADLIIAIGGDGTLLQTARALAGYEIPLVGINQGRIGFLTDIPADNMDTDINRILDGEYEKEERALIEAEILRDGESLHRGVALNEIIMAKGDVARLIEFETYVDGKFVHSIRADGMIISTPTGSTAYALSAGGPILYPALPAILMVPICPHTLSDRPMIIADNSQIEFVLTRTPDHNVQICFDGQETQLTKEKDHLRVRKANVSVQLLHPPGRDYFEMLRSKLHWGEKLY